MSECSLIDTCTCYITNTREHSRTEGAYPPHRQSSERQQFLFALPVSGDSGVQLESITQQYRGMRDALRHHVLSEACICERLTVLDLVVGKAVGPVKSTAVEC